MKRAILHHALWKNNGLIIPFLIIALFLIVGLGMNAGELSGDGRGLEDTASVLLRTELPTDDTSTISLTTDTVPGLVPADAVLYLEDLQFSCKEVKDHPEYYHWYCKRELKDIIFEVGIFSKTLGMIELLDANIRQMGEISDETTIDLFKLVIDMSYRCNEKEEAYQWVNEVLPSVKNRKDIRQANFDGVQFRVYGEKSDRSLEIGNIH